LASVSRLGNYSLNYFTTQERNIMLKRLRPQVAGLTGLLLASLWLAACGGVAESTSQGQAPSAQTEGADASCASTTSSAACAETAATETEVAATTPAGETDQAATSTEGVAASETAVTEEAAASPTQSSVTVSNEANCQAIDIPSNELAVAVSADDWSKGPDNAPVTLIEYGDFQ
jgi:hypothetical protein